MSEKSAKAENQLRNLIANPFLVLGLPVAASHTEVERQGQMLLAMIATGVADAKNYGTPLGPRERTAELVREAVAELRDPDKRLQHEWWRQQWESP